MTASQPSRRDPALGKQTVAECSKGRDDRRGSQNVKVRDMEYKIKFPSALGALLARYLPTRG